MNAWLLLSSPKSRDVGLLVIRVGVGLIFVGHGFLKILGGPESWVWLGNQMVHFGITAWPMAWGLSAMASEFLGGLCLALGFYARIAAFFISNVMIVAFTYHMASGDSYAKFSYPLTMLSVMIGFLIAGGGIYSLDAWRARKKGFGIKKLKKEDIESHAKAIGDAIGIDWHAVNLEQFKQGLAVELEHGLCDRQTNVTNDDPIMTGKIALAHLKELTDYYTRLEKMEKK
jgi:putative oxidoreductase